MTKGKVPEAPEFALLKPSTKALIRRLGNTEEHRIEIREGDPGKGWLDAEDMGWIFVRTGFWGGYQITFTLTGWERWCRQVDVEDGMRPEDLPNCEYD